MNWIEKLDLDQSIKEIQSEERRAKDFCLDPLRFEDLSIKKVKINIIESIKEKLRSSYNVDRLITIDVPKSNFTLRPAARPCLIDWIIYNALVNYIGSVVYDKIPHNSYSFNKFRYKNSNRKKYSIIDYWLDFEKESVSLSKNKKFSYLLVTDITSFFEHISIEVLEQRLKFLSNDEDYVGAVNFLINNVLIKWTENNKIKKFGLPQGPMASGVLADIYLYSVDRSMSKNNIKFLRYMDDIRLYTGDKTELKKDIMQLVRSLRDLKLNLNAKKTYIYELKEKERLKNVFDPESSRLDLIDKAFRTNKKDQILLVIPYLLELKDLSLTDSNFSERYFKFFVGRVIDMMKFNLVDKKYIKKLCVDFFELFEEKHHLTQVFCWFFIASSQYSKDLQKFIREKLIVFINDKNKNIYEWQEMWVLDTIRQMGKMSKNNFKKIKKKCRLENELCYSQFVLIKGMSGNNDDREEILESRRLGGDQYRSTLLSIQELNMDVINNAQLIIPSYFKEYVYNMKGKKYGFCYNLIHNELDVKNTFDTEFDYFEY